jgi:hypothetical protein
VFLWLGVAALLVGTLLWPWPGIGPDFEVLTFADKVRRDASPRRRSQSERRRTIGSADDLGLAMVTLSRVFGASALIRRWTRPLRAVFIPTAVIGGFLALALGPEGIGRIGAGNGIFSPETFAVSSSCRHACSVLSPCSIRPGPACGYPRCVALSFIAPPTPAPDYARVLPMSGSRAPVFLVLDGRGTPLRSNCNHAPLPIRRLLRPDGLAENGQCLPAHQAFLLRL